MGTSGMDTQVTAPSSPCRMSPDGSSLLLEGLQAADSGAYTCLARNSAGEDTQLHTLNVLGEQSRDLRAVPGPSAPYSHISPSVPSPVPPAIQRGADDSEVVRGVLSAMVTLECQARGSPPLHVTWLKDGLPLLLSPRVTLLSAGHVLR